MRIRLRTWWHAEDGTLTPPGEVIELPDADAVALFQQGVGEPVREMEVATAVAVQPEVAATRVTRRGRRKGRK